MGNYLNVGNAGFTAVTKGIYVDKTELIAFINSTLGTMDKLTCVSRPRRFGKSYHGLLQMCPGSRIPYSFCRAK